MRSEADVIHYYEKFLVLSKPPLDSQRLIPGTRNKIFWCEFHKKDCAEMYPRLVAEHRRQPVDVHFDYLYTYEAAGVILISHVLDIESDNSSDEPHSARSRRSGRIQEHRYDHREDSDLLGGYSTSWTHDH